MKSLECKLNELLEELEIRNDMGDNTFHLEVAISHIEYLMDKDE